MRRLLGVAVLLAGVGGLGLWAEAHQARRIERLIAAAAARATADALHDVQTRVSGRDITVTGTADTKDEHNRLIAALDRVAGRRVVIDDLTILPVARPFTLSVSKDQGGSDLTATGNVPSEAARADLATNLGGDAAALVMASGAPEGWLGVAQAAIAALEPLDFGRAEVIDANLKVVGQARTPAEAAAVNRALAALPPETVTVELSLLDDGTPARWTLDYTAAGGASLSGKLPVGLDRETVAAALGLAVAGEPTVAMIGPPGDTALLSALRPWLPQVETLLASVDPTGADLVVTLAPDADPGLVAEAMKADLSATGPVDVRAQSAPSAGANGIHRINAATGQDEVLSSGFWLPVVRIAPSVATCTQRVEELLSGEGIGFLSGSDRLDARAGKTVNRLAAIMLPCTQDAHLRAVIGGHTGTAGDAQMNLGLSQRRAVTLRRALIARGVPAAALKAQGFGGTRPATPVDADQDGAANNRITVDWSEQE